MRKFTIATITLPFLLLILFSCGGDISGVKVPADKKNYIGTWRSEEIVLQIDESGSVDYKRDSGGSTTSVNAPIQKFEGNNFVVGALGFNTTFIVSKVPHQENGVWIMTVDGRELTRD
ncbi:MAG: hypothetical protein QE487_08630 [Fluviicola sp.]|nr:hypothetical protein [Fluviicola sp.]